MKTQTNIKAWVLSLSAHCDFVSKLIKKKFNYFRVFCFCSSLFELFEISKNE
jgi:hypothetical protein